MIPATAVVALGRDPQGAAQAAARLVGAGLDVVPGACDISRPDEVAGLASRLGDLAAPDLLVCSAGVMGGARTLLWEDRTPVPW